MANSPLLPAPVAATLPALAHLPEGRAGHYAEASLRGAANTQKAYASDFRQFAAYCQTAGVESSPAQPQTLADYLAHLADLGRKYATIQR
ncbi:MAG: integrase, partial [Hymenobacter sp.]